MAVCRRSCNIFTNICGTVGRICRVLDSRRSRAAAGVASSNRPQANDFRNLLSALFISRNRRRPLFSGALFRSAASRVRHFGWTSRGFVALRTVVANGENNSVVFVRGGDFRWTISGCKKILFFQLSPDAVCEAIYTSQNPFVESIAVARFIREHSAADARVAVVGSEPQIYFYARRHSATGYIYTYPLMESQPYAILMEREMGAEIEANRPEYLVLVMYRYSWLFHDSSDTEILSWVTKYAGEAYEKTGLINMQPDGRSIYLWGEAAKNYQGRLDQFIVIYKHKPELKSAPPAN